MKLQRIRMNHDAPSSPIYHVESGVGLGTFHPGLGYWVTPENYKSAHAMVEAGNATYETPADAPLSSSGPIRLGTAEGQVTGFLEVKD